jgi:RNA polymerase sigma-54 factor
VVEIAVPYYGTPAPIRCSNNPSNRLPADKAELWQTDLDQATLLIKCLQQRNHTIVRLAQRLAVLQRDFILYGEAHLQPITRAHLAGELEVHESTISRAVSGKGVQLPNRRILPMATFFDRSLHIRTALKQIIEEKLSRSATWNWLACFPGMASQ